MKLIDHPNVLNLYDVWETSSELYGAFIHTCLACTDGIDTSSWSTFPVASCSTTWSSAVACQYQRPFTISNKSSTPWTTATDSTSATAISSLRTCCWTVTRTSRSPTLEWLLGKRERGCSRRAVEVRITRRQRLLLSVIPVPGVTCLCDVY